MKKIVFLDMDGVIANFNGSHHFTNPPTKVMNHHQMYIEGFFSTLPVLKDARAGVRMLLNLCENYGVELHILTKPLKHNPSSYSEKIEWIGRHFPELIGNITLTQNKELLAGKHRLLIDDDLRWFEKWCQLGGEFISFDESCGSLDYWADLVCEIESAFKLWDKQKV